MAPREQRQQDTMDSAARGTDSDIRAEVSCEPYLSIRSVMEACEVL
jgi:hypothetical protein